MLGGFAVDRFDPIARRDACPESRRPVHHAADGGDLVALDNREPDDGEFASNVGLHGAGVLSADVAGMGVERASHGSQRRFDQLGFVGPVDIFVLDQGENGPEPRELAVRIVRRGARARDGDQGDRARRGPDNGAGGHRKGAMSTGPILPYRHSTPRIEVLTGISTFITNSFISPMLWPEGRLKETHGPSASID